MSNSQVVKINNYDLTVKEFRGQRVVTFKDIDQLHQRPEGTASRNFSQNKHRFIEGVDYFHLSKSEMENTKIVNYSSPKGLTLLTESGYLMLVKSFTDDLAWEVQRKLVNNYFRAKQIIEPKNQFDLMRMMIDQIETAYKEATEAKALALATQETLDNVKETLIHTDQDWRNWVNRELNKIAFQAGNYKEIRAESYRLLEERGHCRLEVRLKNLKERMAEEGYTKTAIKNANYLDVIEQEPRLKEIYTSIVKELSIKYSA